MAAITRRMAINNAHTILKNYRKKINDANQYKEYLPLVGQQIIERYKNNSDNYKTLLDEAADSKSFFIGMGDETLISYNNICDRLNNIFDLNVSESRKINGFIDEQFVVRSAEEVITGIRTVEIGRKVEYKLGTEEILDAEKTVDGILDRFYIEWEVEDVDNNFSTEHNKAEAVTENIIDFFDNKFSNPYDRTFEAVKEGRYIIKAKVHDKFDCNEIVDIIDFEQIVEHGDDSIISMEFKEKILEALKLTDWSIKIDFVAFSQALLQATVALCFLGGLSTVAPEVTLLIIALIAAGTKLKATFDTIRGIVVIVEALTLIEKARSKRALQVGGQKIKEGLLYLGEGALEFIIAKCTMKNVANARIQVLRNVTPQPQALPQTALPAPNVAGSLPVKATTGLPAINATAEEVTLLMNKSAMQAMENVAEMAVVQSEKVELQELVSDNITQINTNDNNDILKLKNEICSKTSPNEIYSVLEASPRDYQMQLFDMLSNDIKYQLVQSDNCKWITNEITGYDITKENVGEYLKLEYIDNEMKINLDWPYYGGYKPETIKGLDYLFSKENGKIEISRMGSINGNALGFGKNSDGTWPSAAQRGLLKTEKQSFVTTGIMDMNLYKEIVDVLADDTHDRNYKIQKLKEIYKPREKILSKKEIDDLFEDYTKFPLKSEMIGNNSIKDAIRIFNLDVGNEIYGYCGKADKWNDLEGGANQMNTVFSLKTMDECDIITNVEKNIPVRSK